MIPPTAAADDATCADVFPGDSAMARAMRALDWAATPLGPAHLWPEGLKVPLRMMLTSRFEMWLGWGPDLAFFYNDAYVPTLGRKHPRALGQPMREVWHDVYADVEDRIVSVMRDGIATWDKALMLLMDRSGYREETYHTFSYSPLQGRSGVEGLMCVVTEETEKVIGERRLETLRVLAMRLLGARSREGLVTATHDALATNQRDFPFARVLLGKSADVAEAAGSVLGDAIVGAGAGPRGTAQERLNRIVWPLAPLFDGAEMIRLPLATILPDPPRGAWDGAPDEALIVPIRKVGHDGPSGCLVVGLNPYRPQDADILGFTQLLAGQIAGALATIDADVARVVETERLRQLFAQSPSFMAVLRGPEHRFELINPAYATLVAHRDIVGKPAREALPEVAGQGFFEILDQVFASGESYAGRSKPITIQRTPDAAPEQRYLDFVYQPIRDGGGATTGIFVEGIDVTPAHEAAASLRAARESLEVLNATLEQRVADRTRERDRAWRLSQDLLVVAERDGTMRAVNAAWTELLGWKWHELVGARFVAFTHPADLDATLAAFASIFDRPLVTPYEYRLRHRDGTYRWFAWTGAFEDGVVYASGRHTTAEHEQADALRAAEEQLRQSQKMEAVGQLTGGLAHDFNNLLTGITGSLDLLQSRVAQGRFTSVDRYVNAAQGAAKRAAALTHRLLAFSRRQTLDAKPTNINRLVSGMEDLLRRTVGPGITVETVGAAGLWTTLVDPNQLENALLNLCINARDAMPDGGRITVETTNTWMDQRVARERDLAPGQYVSLCVTDTGTGMPPDVVERAFDPFFTTKPLGEGTGLGLSMIYGFARQSNGQVRIYSEVGHGTTMCIYLPRHHGAEESAEAEQDLAAAPRAEQGETVLVVDDEPTVRMLVTEVLEDLGYSAIEAADGASGLKVLQTDARIDLLVTDVGLPGGMNGRQVADAGRALRPDLKVLFITGYAENAVIGNGHLDPGMQVLTKPFAMEALATRIKSMIAKG